ncbi:MAG: TerB family tellurite resistance protein [Sandaracinaceae bacterium]
MAVDPRFLTITDLLLGAVHADERLEGGEEDAVRRLLRVLLATTTLPDEVDARIRDFDSARFDLKASAASFAASPPVTKRTLLELVAAVFEADSEVDFAEDDYLRALAEALGMQESEYSDLSLQYEVEEIGDLKDRLEMMVSIPPVPKS